MSPLKGFFTSSIAHKFWMAITGIFLVTFLIVHLGINLSLFFGPVNFNAASHFMATNPVIQVMQYVLAAGFLVHIVMGIRLTIKNNAARPIKYAYEKASENSTWASRNMIITGLLVLVFILLHLRDFLYEIKFTDHVTSDYILVTQLFSIWYYTLFYVVAFIALGIHLSHGFNSAFQSVGLRNHIWKPFLMGLSIAYCIVIAVGFSSIAIYFFCNPA